MTAGSFDDVMAANRRYAEGFDLGGLEPVAARGIGIVTCMDSRIEPLQMLGLKPGDAKILRNAGARVTDDVVRTLVLATHLLGVERIMVIAHTRCKMASATEDEVDAQILAQSGIDVRSIDFQMITDQADTLRRDVQRIRSSPFLPPGVEAAAFVYDVDTGVMTKVP